MTTMLDGYGHKKAMRLVQSDLLWVFGLALVVGLLSARVATAEDANDGKQLKNSLLKKHRKIICFTYDQGVNAKGNKFTLVEVTKVYGKKSKSSASGLHILVWKDWFSGLLSLSEGGVGMFGSPKRSGARGFHEGIFDQGFGGFSTLKKRAGPVQKRRPEMTSRGIHGDAFTGDVIVTTLWSVCRGD